MTDKELKAKILAEIERRMEFHKERKRPEDNAIQDVLYGVISFINSFPEEHPYKTGDKVWYLNELYTLEDDGKHYILTAVRDKVTVSVVHLDYGDEDYELLPYEEPVSEDLEEASRRYALNNTPYDDCADEMQEAFKAGAQWQKKQFE